MGVGNMISQVGPKSVVVAPVKQGFGVGTGINNTGGPALGHQGVQGYNAQGALGFTADASFGAMGNNAMAGVEGPALDASMREGFAANTTGSMPNLPETTVAKAIEVVNASGLRAEIKTELVKVLNGLTQNTSGDEVVDKVAQVVQMSADEITAAKALFEG